MYNISKLLEMWGAWIVNNPNILILFIDINKEIIPERIRKREVCSIHQLLIINSLISKLMKKNKNDYNLLIDYYVNGKTFIQLSKLHNCSDTYIGKKLKKIEGVIEGMLIFLDIQPDFYNI
ncbi:antiterminator Q family protein [Proteus myxofaciens]|uniref:Antitermination protein Q n=1 Tax=Proteus myxofaciens ATCC 19692 TaxID=1354337 RepID=A0A198F9M8_9GAMM|nr:antiterminator Q family protein [Proteus myxofaciens]OAT21577.1 antitermination protein Q [Proteus myxofaciens ATCC 19692]